MQYRVQRRREEGGEAEYKPVFPRIMTDKICPRGGGRSRWPPRIRIRSPDFGRPIGIYRPGLITEFYNTGRGEIISWRSTLGAFLPNRFRSIFGVLFLLSKLDRTRHVFNGEYKSDLVTTNVLYCYIRLNDISLERMDHGENRK